MPLTLGTAGHIDHGKTTLVEALTGTNTDRLPEERARGISIELGYAPLVLPSGRRISVVDVPGHERFVRTMVAGATGIDFFLLVVDAAEGPKPQTYEHLEILRLLGVERGVVAVTKIDAVEPSRVPDVSGLVAGAEVVHVSAVTGEGLAELSAALDRAATDRAPSGAPTRLYVDRVFSLPGAGQIATGTLWSGEIAAGDRLEVLPGGFELRVRSVHVHGDAVERAAPGQRVAVAYTPERRREVRRGDAIVAPSAYPVSFRLDVELHGDVPDDARVQVCHGTRAVPARVVRLDGAHAQLRLAQPLVTASGDRLVLRQETTIGGGTVLDPAPPRHADAAHVGRASVDAPVRRSDLLRRGIDLDGLEQAGEWVFSSRWLDDLRERARAKAAGGGQPATALVGEAPWAQQVVPLLGLEHSAGRYYLPGQTPAPDPADDVKLGDGSRISRGEYERARALLVAECEAHGTISLARFRDLLSVSRKVAQLLLERFDADRVTLRVGDVRRLRRSAVR